MTVLALICVVMFATLAVTGNLKEERYGSTPPFASIGLLYQELTLRVRYAIERQFWGFSQTALSALAVTSLDLSFDRDKTPNRMARALPVLTYHRVVDNENDLNNVTTAIFRDQMLTLKRAGWETITLQEYTEFLQGKRELPERSFLITFDDGAKESFYPVDPLFEALGYEGVMYIIAAAAHTPESTYYLSPTEIQRMLRTGRWEIGSHSYDGHRPYPAGSDGRDGIFFADKLWLPGQNRIETEPEFVARVRDDLARARSELEAEYGVNIDSFAFPLGNETGIEGAANFPEGAAITEREASNLYSLGFLQTNKHQYTFNFPRAGFISRRIHVEHDWNGERLLREMEQGLEKTLPFEDDFEEDRGWIPAWGSLDFGRNNLVLSADKETSSASTFLDGSAYWSNYTYDASVDWQSGSVFLLADVMHSKTYHSCAFSDGVVRVQSTTDGETTVLAEKKDEYITYRSDTRIGMRVHDNVIECTWDYASIVEAYERLHTGGIGIQVWNPELGTAQLRVSQVLVRPYATTTPKTSDDSS